MMKTGAAALSKLKEFKLIVQNSNLSSKIKQECNLIS